MTRYGVEIYLDLKWLFVETATRDEAITLQRLSAEKCPETIKSRQVILTEEGHLVRVHATE